jgi:hypothetical protein
MRILKSLEEPWGWGEGFNPAYIHGTRIYEL